MSEFSIEESGRTLKVRSRSASWLFGIVLLLFLGALLFLVVRSIVDGWPQMGGWQLVRLVGFAAAGLAVLGTLFFFAVGVRELNADSDGIRCRAVLLGFPIWTKQINWPVVTSIKCRTVEGTTEDGGYYTLEIEHETGKQQLFTMAQGDEIRQVVALLKQQREQHRTAGG